MLGNDKWDFGEIVAMCLAVIVVAVGIHALVWNHLEEAKKCEWEKAHNIISYECKDWGGE